MPRVKLTGRKVDTVLGAVDVWLAPSARWAPSPPAVADGRARSASVTREITGVGGAAAAMPWNVGMPEGMAPVPGGDAGGRPAAGGMAVGAAGAGAGGGGVGAGGGDAVACWVLVSRFSSSANRCRVLFSKASRSLLTRLCASRSVSYWASLRPAVPTHWSTGLTWPPGGITPMLVTSPGWVWAARPLCGLASLPAKLKIIHSRPMPPPRMAASSAYWRWRGDRRSSQPRTAWPGGRPDPDDPEGMEGVLIACLPAGSHRRWWSRPAAGCGVRSRCR